MSDATKNPTEPLEGDDLAAVERLKAAFTSLKAEMGKVKRLISRAAQQIASLPMKAIEPHSYA